MITLKQLLEKDVTDKKTGEKYDPEKKFKELLHHPDTKAQLKRMKDEKGKGWPKSVAHNQHEAIEEGSAMVTKQNKDGTYDEVDLDETLKVGDKVKGDYPGEENKNLHVTYIHSSGKVKLADHKGISQPNYREPKNIKKIHEAVELDESKMAEIHAGIHDIVEKPGVHSISIGTPSIHTHSDYRGKKQYVVHPVTYHKEGQKHKQGYQTYVHHEVGSTDVKPGLPKKQGGVTVSITK